FQVSKVIWKRLLRKNKEQLKQSKVYIYERPSFGKSNGKYTPYPKVDSFLKVCQTLGLAGIDLFTPSDVVEKRNVRKVCMCIRSLSKKAGMMQLNVPDFDVVTHTIAMPNYIVGGIRRSLEQPQCSSSCSSGHSPHAISKSIFEGQSDEQSDRHYDSDEAESSLFVLGPQDSLDDDKLSELLQLGDAPKEEREGYGDSGHEMPEEKSLAESAGSLDAGVMDADTTNSTPFHENLLSPTDRCSTTRTNKCSLSSEESDSINSYLASDSCKNDLNGPPVKVSERIHDGHAEPSHDSVQGNGKIFTDHPEKDDSARTKDHMGSLQIRQTGYN
uniref:Calponin-homology (CH) domain-containing protein n=1 Tax=Aegilops tauschii subsp. strangulata TaxID=200361 RepID=A0A453H5Z3_AEGTS